MVFNLDAALVSCAKLLSILITAVMGISLFVCLGAACYGVCKVERIS